MRAISSFLSTFVLVATVALVACSCASPKQDSGKLRSAAAKLRAADSAQTHAAEIESSGAVGLELVDTAFLPISASRRIQSFVPTSDKYYLFDRTSDEILVFDHSGRFIRAIGGGGKRGFSASVYAFDVRDSTVVWIGDDSIQVHVCDTAGKILDTWLLGTMLYSNVSGYGLCINADGSLFAGLTYVSEIESLLIRKHEERQYLASPLMRLDVSARKSQRVAFVLQDWSSTTLRYGYNDMRIASAPGSPLKTYCCFSSIPSVFEVDLSTLSGRKIFDIPAPEWVDLHKMKGGVSRASLRNRWMESPNNINAFAVCRCSGRLIIMVEVLRYVGRELPMVREYYFTDSAGAPVYIDRNAPGEANLVGAYTQDSAAYFCTVNAGWDPVKSQETIRVRRSRIVSANHEESGNSKAEQTLDR